MIHRYRPNGKSHEILEAVAAGDESHLSICKRIGIELESGPRRKAWYILGKLCEDGYVADAQGKLTVTAGGLRALDRLRAGDTIEIDTDGRAAVMQGAA